MNIRTLIGVIHSEMLHWIEVILFRFNKPIQEFIHHANVMPTEETVKYIIDHRCSVSRYGDGEFYVMRGGGNDFQHSDDRLRIKLIEVFTKRNPNLLICIPYAWKDLRGLKRIVRVFYKRFLLRNYPNILKWIDSSVCYGDALFSRFYMDYADKNLSMKRIELIKKIWEERDLWIIEGVYTRMGVGNDLFSSSRSIHRILAPSKNAFDKYDTIMDSVRHNVPKDKNVLILLALGMTATVMASDLCKEGWQAIDIGHLDVEYEWMLMGATRKVPIASRFVNEANNYDQVVACKDKDYLKQIVASV